MDKSASLLLFREMVETTRRGMSKRAAGLFLYFRAFVHDLGDVTDHVDDVNLRLAYLRLLSTRSIFEVYCDYLLQESTGEAVRELTESDPVVLRESALYAASKIETHALSDANGRQLIDIDSVLSTVGKAIPKMDDASKTGVLSILVTALRGVQWSVEKDTREELEAFYGALSGAAAKDWPSVLAEIDDFAVKWDKVSSPWQRR